MNRDAEKPEQSRWSTAQSTTQEARTLTLDLGAVKTFSQFVIEWEGTNITISRFLFLTQKMVLIKMFM